MHIPHPHIQRRKAFADKGKKAGFNQWLAVTITNGVGSMWCAYAFAIICFISLPEAIEGGTGPLVTWMCQTFLQLVLLSIIMVGQNIAAAKSELQLELTYRDAEALLQIDDEMQQLLKANSDLTTRVHELLQKNLDLNQAAKDVIERDVRLRPST